jgi:hypothetical protein
MTDLLRLYPAEADALRQEPLRRVEQRDQRKAAHDAGGEDARPVLGVLIAEQGEPHRERVEVLVADYHCGCGLPPYVIIEVV